MEPEKLSTVFYSYGVTEVKLAVKLNCMTDELWPGMKVLNYYSFIHLPLLFAILPSHAILYIYI